PGVFGENRRTIEPELRFDACDENLAENVGPGIAGVRLHAVCPRRRCEGLAIAITLRVQRREKIDSREALECIADRQSLRLAKWITSTPTKRKCFRRHGFCGR